MQTYFWGWVSCEAAWVCYRGMRVRVQVLDLASSIQNSRILINNPLAGKAWLEKFSIKLVRQIHFNGKIHSPTFDKSYYQSQIFWQTFLLPDKQDKNKIIKLSRLDQLNSHDWKQQQTILWKSYPHNKKTFIFLISLLFLYKMTKKQ